MEACSLSPSSPSSSSHSSSSSSSLPSSSCQGLLCLLAGDSGCGHRNNSECLTCLQCNRELVSAQNNRSLSFTLGQPVWFARRGSGLFEQGSVVAVKGSIVTVKYADSAWRDDKYDEEVCVDDVYVSMEEAAPFGQRKRKQVELYTTPSTHAKRKKASSSTEDVDAKLMLQNSRRASNYSAMMKHILCTEKVYHSTSDDRGDSDSGYNAAYSDEDSSVVDVINKRGTRRGTSEKKSNARQSNGSSISRPLIGKSLICLIIK